MELMEILCTKEHFSDESKYHREISICVQTINLLTEACRDNELNGTMVYWASDQLVHYEVQTALSTGRTLTQIYRNNEQVSIVRCEESALVLCSLHSLSILSSWSLFSLVFVLSTDTGNE